MRFTSPRAVAWKPSGFGRCGRYHVNCIVFVSLEGGGERLRHVLHVFGGYGEGENLRGLTFNRMTEAIQDRIGCRNLILILLAVQHRLLKGDERYGDQAALGDIVYVVRDIFTSFFGAGIGGVAHAGGLYPTFWGLSRGVWRDLTNAVKRRSLIRMSEEDLIVRLKGIEAEMSELRFICEVLLNRYGVTKEQLEVYRRLKRQGELNLIF